jgi:hypothetical protein
MAKQGKVLPARKPREEESLLLRSAESLGRMIGSLQRQLDDASRHLPREIMMPSIAAGRNGASKRARTPVDRQRTSANARPPRSARKSGATKARSTADRKSKRASKSAAAKKSNGRTRKAARHA